MDDRVLPSMKKLLFVLIGLSLGTILFTMSNTKRNNYSIIKGVQNIRTLFYKPTTKDEFFTTLKGKNTPLRTSFKQWIAPLAAKVKKKPFSKFATHEDIPMPIVNHANCKHLFQLGSQSPVPDAALSGLEEFRKPDSDYHNVKDNCKAFLKERKYILKPVTKEEAEYPLAYSLLIYKNVQQVEQLLRAIYRPQNYYCLHIDGGARPEFSQGMRSIASCFPNVFPTSKSYHVRWGYMTVLLPEILCMRELWNYTDWKYFINLTGQEFPLKTNTDLVRILKTMGGANGIDFNLANNPTFHYRTARTWDGVRPIGKPKAPAPYGINITYGSVHIAATRGFVDFVIHSDIAKEILNWVSDTRIPDETYFATLQINPQLGVPGAFTGDINSEQKYHDPATRFKVWSARCRKGKNNVCILDVRYLPPLAGAKQMFANKFFYDYQPTALLCLEELLFNRTRDDLYGERDVDLQYFKSLLHVKHHT